MAVQTTIAAALQDKIDSKAALKAELISGGANVTDELLSEYPDFVKFVKNYTAYNSRVLADSGTVDNDELLKSNFEFFISNGILANVLFAWNEFAGAKDNKAYNLYGTTDLIGTQTYDRGMMCFNGTDQKATVDITGYNTVAIACRTYQDVIITSDLTGLGEISGNTLHLGSNAAETEFYAFDMLALVVLDSSNYSIVDSYFEVLPLGEKEKYFDFAIADGSKALGMIVRLPVSNTLKVVWGDGTVDSYSGAGNNVNVNLTHTYASAGNYPIKFSGDYLSLTILYCYNNSLTGDVSGWSALTKLIDLHCHLNSLTGDVSSWSALTKLINLNCHTNSLTGDVSSWSALTDLTILYCYNNSLTGDVSSWSALTKLINLNCHTNSLTGDVSSWSALTKLINLNCHTNSLTGDVSSWSALTKLINLNCHTNSLTGDVSSWSALTKLTYLSCGDNSLTGDVSSWSALTDLTILYCYNNSLTGDVSSWSALTDLTILYCYNNSLTGLTVNAKDISLCRAENNTFTTAAVDAFFLNTANYYQNNAPTKNCAFNLSGATMGIPTGGAGNVDIARLVSYYSAAGFIATVIIRTS